MRIFVRSSSNRTVKLENVDLEVRFFKRGDKRFDYRSRSRYRRFPWLNYDFTKSITLRGYIVTSRRQPAVSFDGGKKKRVKGTRLVTDFSFDAFPFQGSAFSLFVTQNNYVLLNY